ncbi:hypothetical protein BH09CHL1_BH09CHL1_21250 [soil metagenome]
MLRIRRCSWFAAIVWLAIAGFPLSAAAFPTNTNANPWLITPPSFCPVTIPNNEPPPGWEYEISNYWHHSGSLWVSFPPSGIQWNREDQLDADGYIWDKMIWVRESLEWPIHVTGFLISDPSITLKVQLPTDANQSFVALQGMAVGYARPGCWEVTGTAGPHSLTFVIWVTTVK